MNRPRLAPLIAPALAAILATVLAGCGAEATLSEHSVENGAQASSGTVIVHDAYLVATTSGSTRMYVTLFNNSGAPDTLTSVTPAAGAPARFTVTLPAGGITVRPGGVALLESTRTALRVSKVSGPLAIGTEVPVTFSFAAAGTLSATVPVESETGDAGVADSASPLPS